MTVSTSAVVEAAVEAIKSPVPTASTATIIILGYPLSDWVLILSACYTLLQFCTWVWDRVIRPTRSKNESE